MAISRDEVLHVAGLARLELTDEEVERFREQLNAILEAVGKVAELDLSDVEPTAHPSISSTPGPTTSRGRRCRSRRRLRTPRPRRRLCSASRGRENRWTGPRKGTLRRKDVSLTFAVAR